MIRSILGVIAGLVSWALVATLLDIGLRQTLPGYVQAEPLLAFTLLMKVARLMLAVLASLVAGASVAGVAPASRPAPWIVGLLLLAMFLPAHIRIGSRLPLWYHLFFLVTLAPVVVAGAQLLKRRQSRRKGEANQTVGRAPPPPAVRT